MFLSKSSLSLSEFVSAGAIAQVRAYFVRELEPFFLTR